MSEELDNQRTLAKSKKWWKKVQTERPLKSNTKPKSDWNSKMKKKNMEKQVRALQEEIRQKLVDEKKEILQAKKEREERRKQNLLKSEIVQVIKNPSRLKRMKKKQLRMIQKRDITKE
ncbi:hypothetical protein ACQ4LE_004336 [Meloidogyne hapla]